jgi:transposase
MKAARPLSSSKGGLLPSIHEGRDVKKMAKQEYAAEFNVQAVGHTQMVDVVVAAKEFGLIEQAPRNWTRAGKAGKLVGAGVKTVTAERLKLSRLRAENAAEDTRRNPKKSDRVLCEGCAAKHVSSAVREHVAARLCLADACDRRRI